MSGGKLLGLDDPGEAVLGARTCSGCRHWHQGPIDPRNVGAVRPGECRRELVTVARPDGMLMSLYPQTAPAFPACSHYEARPNGEAV